MRAQALGARGRRLVELTGGRLVEVLDRSLGAGRRGRVVRAARRRFVAAAIALGGGIPFAARGRRRRRSRTTNARAATPTIATSASRARQGTPRLARGGVVRAAGDAAPVAVSEPCSSSSSWISNGCVRCAAGGRAQAVPLTMRAEALAQLPNQLARRRRPPFGLARHPLQCLGRRRRDLRTQLAQVGGGCWSA